MMRRRGLAPCCILHKRMISIDLDEQNITTYDGLERCIKQSQSYDDGNESSASRSITTDSSLFDDDASSSNSSNTSTSNNTDFRSSSLLSSDLTAAIMKREPEMCEFSAIPSPQSPHTCVKVKVTKYLDVVEAMKVKFSKLLLGEDMTGGSNGVSTALALSNAILNLSTSVFGELWKLEPLSEEKKRIWQQEMEWFLSPTNYMVELVPSTQNGDNGCIYEIMTPKARPDVQMNLPALQKLDIMLIETLDSMVDTEFWYSEVGSSRAEGGSKRWWLPSPQVPMRGLCDGERKKLMDSGKLVNQILKASKAINENVLLEMTVPAFIRDAIPKSAKANLGEDLYQILTRERVSTFDDMVESLNLKTEHNALETINRLEAAILVWKEKMAEEADCIPMSWSSFIKHPKTFEVVDGINVSLNHAEALLRKIRTRYPNLPHTFLDMMKIQYGKDIGHAILEAYSRVLGNLAYTILARIGAVLQEDILSNPNSPAKGLHLPSGT
ncbi:unnamed protein product, partial [Cuscuta europaea]